VRRLRGEGKDLSVEKTMNPICRFDIQVTAEMVDRNGHVNNVAYIQWMQDAAIHHARTSGCTQATLAAGATWVVRTHQIEYLAPTFAGDEICVLTWVANFKKVRSLRKYKMIRAGDQTVVARAETNWVFVNATSGRPQAIPEVVKATLPVVGDEREP
jgi:acyl-CoA thioester hydrolase